MTTVEGMTRSAAQAGRGFRADVQGMRAIAVGLVLLYHAGVPFVSGGYIGVDVFFVISGYLISSHLLDSLQRNGRIDFGEFYARRVRRILPASLVVAVLTAAAAVVVVPPLGLERVLKDGLATILYVPNVWFAIQNTNYLADHSPSPYQHYWSLGVEEQFYLGWPLLLMVLVLLVRRRRGLVIGAIAVFAAGSFALGIVVTPMNQPYAFFLLPTRAWELLLGALVAALLLRRALAIPNWVAAIGSWCGLAVILVCSVAYDDQTVFPGTAALAPALGAALMILFGSVSAAGGPGMALATRPMQFIGLISYSLYLVHWPLLVLSQAAVGEQHPLDTGIKILIGVVLAVPAAWLLFRFVETPLRSPSWLTKRRPRVTLVGILALTMALALSFGVTIAWSSTRDVPAGPPVSVAPSTPQVPPHATEVLPSNLRPKLAAVADDVPRLYGDGCHNDFDRAEVQECRYGAKNAHTLVALFGDSHAAQWFPALADWAETNTGVGIDVYTKSSCPSANLTVLDKGVPYVSCDRWRDAVLAALVAAAPDVVVISNYSAYQLPGVSGDKRETAWGEGVEETVKQLEAAGSQVLLISDTPRFESPPPTCISGNPTSVKECAGPRADVLDEPFLMAERHHVEQADGTVLGLSDYICDDQWCPVIVDDLLVYRDVNHLTTPFVSYLAPALKPVLDELVAGGATSTP
ncbi:acyltransferase family protein [Microbacterium sp. KHB019]|uniref:acyltransferase family protein n=1 Tax=Microbacterium sp. KHB019 TaxID=3129770 RepID=UPI00307A3BFC